MNTTPTYVPQQAPPSVYAVAAVLDGEPGGWARVVGNTAVRAVAVAPGIYLGLRLVGVRPTLKHVGAASLAGAATITAFLFAMYAVKRAEA